MIAFDIEVVPDEEKLASRQWAEYKARKNITDDQDAALHPAFSKVVCVCAFNRKDGSKLAVCDTDESRVLAETSQFIAGKTTILGGHNIKGYDIPMLGNRCLANKLLVPDCLRVAGKKPWDIPHVDTVDLLKFGGGPYISLDDICLMLGVPSPKEGEVNALGVWQAYKDDKLDQISTYCGKDVNAWCRCIKILEAMGAC